ncbi:MAG: hypothetical protein IT455_02690 [Planctomycetes bacterium]|nr:hypothetical protein [Planctomycetota bacterium]
MNPSDDLLIEAAISARRPADATLTFHPAFFDLDAAGRERLFAATVQQRTLERCLAGDGLSTTALAVLSRIRGHRGQA